MTSESQNVKKFRKEEIKEIIESIATSKCLWCWQNIDESFNHSYRWRIPLCKNCRIDFLEEETENFPKIKRRKTTYGRIRRK